MHLPGLGKSTKDISASDLIWDFFQRHPKRERLSNPTLDLDSVASRRSLPLLKASTS